MDHYKQKAGTGKLKLKGGGIKKKTSKTKSKAASAEEPSYSASQRQDQDKDADTASAVHDTRTPAQRKFDEIRKIREQREIARTGGQSHQERIQAMNTHLSRLSEHHDMPKIGPG